MDEYTSKIWLRFVQSNMPLACSRKELLEDAGIPLATISQWQ